ncbi:MAG TPA: FAD-dependent monooxygenase [Lacipirellulaceae bacterium]|jgi:2-polyprenyl-6-methoxyphenol hydroxylase-like FAD-dependent oxidoreductase
MTADEANILANSAAAPQTTDVVICGAGPTGLVAAGLLVRCGVSVRIFDKTEQQAHESRAFGVHAKTLELMLNIGLVEEFMDRGLIASGVQFFVDGRRAAELNFADIGRTDTPYSFLLMVPQYDIEAILARDLERLGIHVEHGTEVTGFAQSADGVTVQARGKTGENIEVNCRYLIGADGAHSIVRKTLGLSFAGAPYPQSFLLADCQLDWPLDYDHLKLFVRERSLAAYLPLKGRDICRIIVIEPADTPLSAFTSEASGSDPVTLDEVQTAFREATGMDIRLKNPTWLSRYRIHHRAVNKYGEGRVFVAGDAAHIHSPAGAQGMNTGLQDAANLCWKLAAVLKGGAPAALLESYNAERWPVGQKILERTDRFFSFVSSQTPWVATLRNTLLPIAIGTMSRARIARARAFHFVSQLGIRYRGNDFLRDDASTAAPRAWREGLAAGRRAPNGAIARGRDVFSLIGGYKFHVLALSQQPLGREEIERHAQDLATLPKSLGIEVQIHFIAHSLLGRDPRLLQAESDQVFDAYGLTHETPQALFLIRPDGHIAYRRPDLDVAGLKNFLRERFGCGTV